MKDLTQNEKAQPVSTSWSTPSVDVYRNERELLVIADVPGVKSDAVQVSFHDGALSLEATRTGRDAVHTFRRKFHIEERLDADAIRAELDHGILSIHLPRAPEAQPRSIPVSAG